MKLEPFVPEIVRRHDRGKPWAEWIPGTVLFADVSGFTPMSEALAALGAEGAEVTGFQYDRGLDLQRLNQFVKTVLETTQEYGGRLNRLSMGDKGSTMLLLFGTPAALEKKEQTACQWAVEVLNTARDSFPEMQLRLGMTSGRVFSGIVGGAGRFEFTVMGDCVNLAARLMQGARPDEICTDASMQEKAWEAFEFDSLGPRRFKGKSEVLEVFALRDRRSLRTRQSSAVYGRSEEVSAVQKLMEPARTGNPCMIVLEGEPGVGKSALAAQLLTLAAQDWRIVTGRGDVTRHIHPAIDKEPCISGV